MAHRWPHLILCLVLGASLAGCEKPLSPTVPRAETPAATATGEAHAMTGEPPPASGLAVPAPKPSNE